MDSLVSTDWLAAHLNEADLKLVDSSWHMPATGRSGRDEYLCRAHSRRGLFSTSTPLPTPPTRRRTRFRRPRSSERRWPRWASAAMTGSSSTTIRLCAPPRGAGSCCAISAPTRVAILDGGFQKWLAEGRPTESGEPEPATRPLRGRRGADAVVTKQQLLAGIDTPLVDARGKARFEGAEPEPRPGSSPRAHPRRAQPAVWLALSRGRPLPAGRASSSACFAKPGSTRIARSSPPAARA